MSFKLSEENMVTSRSYLLPDGSIPQIYIFEGIPGSGKDTLIREFLSQYDRERTPIYEYIEDGVLWSWKHFFLPDIDRLRITFLEAMLAFMKQEISRIPGVIFIFNRFHL